MGVPEEVSMKKAKDILAILERTAGAPGDSSDFLYHVSAAIQVDGRLEYRFCGNLGFGGKIWFHPNSAPYVTCYKEDETSERMKLIEQANLELKKFFTKAVGQAHRAFGSGSREEVIQDYQLAAKEAVERASRNGTFVITELVQITMEYAGRPKIEKDLRL